MRYFILLSYNGTDYCGWQIQHNARSIQGEIEKALSTLLNEPINITGAGRTDTSVHASTYYAHFNSSKTEILSDHPYFIYKINAILPLNIAINNIFQVHKDAHARFDATERTYKYYIHTVKNPFHQDFSYYFKFPLDIGLMNKACEYLIGEKDFSCFEKVGSQTINAICDLKYAHWSYIMDDSQKYADSHLIKISNRLVFTITANRFLRNMVRAIVGSMTEIGRGKHDPTWILELLESKNRSKAGSSVTGKALFLEKIKYPYITDDGNYLDGYIKDNNKNDA
ncbi:MAG: tRNA pseudouridine(38-40) synthase TruA [Bacteroidales bacterium]